MNLMRYYYLEATIAYMTSSKNNIAINYHTLAINLFITPNSTSVLSFMKMNSNS